MPELGIPELLIIVVTLLIIIFSSGRLAGAKTALGQVSQELHQEFQGQIKHFDTMEK